MAKRKKRTSSSTNGPSKGINQGSLKIIGITLLVVLIVFIFAAIFDQAGALGAVVHGWLASFLGLTTPVLALLLIWLILRYFYPDKFPFRFVSALGFFLLVLGINGFAHSFISADPLRAAQLGQGGGLIGYVVSNFMINSFGLIIGRLIILVIIFISLLLIFDWLLLPLLLTESSNEDENEDEEMEMNSKVKVVGEVKDGPFGRLKKKLIKPEELTVTPVLKKPSVDSIKPLSRTETWNYPPINLLDIIDMKPQAGNIQKRMELIQKTLRDFGIEVSMAEINVGPTVTQYTLKPADGVKLNLITARQDDLALALAAQSLRVEAPIPGKGLVGIEIPNDKKATVGLRDVLDSKAFKQKASKLALALGRDAAGEVVVADLERMPHILIAGATGSGKSVCINSIILTLLMNNSPDELRMILVDPKRVELTGYNGLPHLLTPVITEPQDTVRALKYCVAQMEKRYKLFARSGKRNIEQYNEDPDLVEGKLPFIVLIIDELADLMMVAAREVESSIVRLAQMARAVGIHLIVATQRPSVDVITGLIKANIPTRIAFAVASQIDSRTILDMSGAEKLLGNGDMLYISTEIGRPKRVQGVYATEKELNSVIAHIKIQEPADRYDPAVLETHIESRLGSSRESGEIDDDLFQAAFEVVKQAGKASTTLLQTRLSVGYARAARLMQSMEDQGLISPANGSKPREVYGSSSSGIDDSTDMLDENLDTYQEND
jgi:S-DNA-T family DNA segregation ATPase FtsK/SpoIIIE